MNCRNHKAVDAKFICSRCRMPICEDCATEVRGNKVCINCIDHALYGKYERVGGIGLLNKFAFFIFACMPGAAHMQMGLFKRGLQLMLTFLGGIVLIAYANIESFIPLAVIPTWFFSFFDAYNIRKKVLSGEDVEDIEAYDYQHIISNRKILGIALVILGFLGLLNVIEYSFYKPLEIFGLSLNRIYWVFKRSVIPCLLIISGIALLRRLKKEAQKESLSQEN